MTNYLYRQVWGEKPITVGMVVKLGQDEVNAYRHGTGEHYMLDGGAWGVLVAMYLDHGVNEDADPECVVRLGNGDQVHCLGQDIVLWNSGVVEC